LSIFIKNGIFEPVMTQVYYKNSKLCLGYFLYEIAHHCNINCASCDHCAPLAKEEFVDFEIFKKDIKRMSEIFFHIDLIGIMGGEPLLNKDVLKILDHTRKIFPSSNIVLFTNGSLLLSQPKTFWGNLNKNNIVVAVTVYKLKIDYRKIKETAERFNVKIGFKPNFDFCKSPFNLSGTEDNRDKIKDCFQGNHCATLENGKLFRCSVAPSSRHLNNYFKTDLKLSENDYLNIHQNSVNSQQITEYFSHSIPFCRYCSLNKRQKISWELSKRRIEEWT